MKRKKIVDSRNIIIDETMLLLADDNEDELIERAELMGAEKVVLLYNINKKNTFERDGMQISSKTYTKDLRKHRDHTIVMVDDGAKLRHATDKFSDSYLIIPLYSLRRMHVNHIVAKLLKKRNNTVVFRFTELLRSRNRTEMFSTMAHCVKIFKKYAVKVNLSPISNDKWDLRSPKDLATFFKVLSK